MGFMWGEHRTNKSLLELDQERDLMAQLKLHVVEEVRGVGAPGDRRNDEKNVAEVE